MNKGWNYWCVLLNATGHGSCTPGNPLVLRDLIHLWFPHCLCCICPCLHPPCSLQSDTSGDYGTTLLKLCGGDD